MKDLKTGTCGSGKRLTKIQATSRLDPFDGQKSGQECQKQLAQREEKQQWAVEKPKLDKARVDGHQFYRSGRKKSSKKP